MTVAKGITNGVVPMGAVLVKRGIHDALMQGPEHVVEFFHGYTYSGHPVACAAGLATLDIYEREKLFERAASLAPALQEAVHSLRGNARVIDIRNIGLVAGIELEPRAWRARQARLRCVPRLLRERRAGAPDRRYSRHLAAAHRGRKPDPPDRGSGRQRAQPGRLNAAASTGLSSRIRLTASLIAVPGNAGGTIRDHCERGACPRSRISARTGMTGAEAINWTPCHLKTLKILNSGRPALPVSRPNFLHTAF